VMGGYTPPRGLRAMRTLRRGLSPVPARLTSGGSRSPAISRAASSRWWRSARAADVESRASSCSTSPRSASRRRSSTASSRRSSGSTARTGLTVLPGRAETLALAPPRSRATATIIENGKIVLDGTARAADGQPPTSRNSTSAYARLGDAQEHARGQALQAAEALAVMSAILEITGVSKSFGGLRAVSDVGFRRRARQHQPASSARTAPAKKTLFNLISAVFPAGWPAASCSRGGDLTRGPRTHELGAGSASGRTFQNPRRLQARDGVCATCWSGMQHPPFMRTR